MVRYSDRHFDAIAGLCIALWTLYLFKQISGSELIFDESLLQIISPVINLFFIRYYFVSKKYEESGKGMLLVTLIYVIAFFVIN